MELDETLLSAPAPVFKFIFKTLRLTFFKFFCIALE